MKPGIDFLRQWWMFNKDDIQYLIFVGLPAGVLMCLLSDVPDYSMLF